MAEHTFIDGPNAFGVQIHDAEPADSGHYWCKATEKGILKEQRSLVLVVSETGIVLLGCIGSMNTEKTLALGSKHPKLQVSPQNLLPTSGKW